tara:strand:- start:22 stop:603 length:582 start_codon:yes stop_codon:yes gene_type:complete
MNVALPRDVTDVIMGIVVSRDVSSVIHEMRGALFPRRRGHAPSSVPPELHATPAAPRRVSVDIPEVMKPLYETYLDDVEFHTAHGLVFMSEREMVSRRTLRSVDLASRYVGMGHVTVHTYIRGPDLVVTHPDGGANGYERAHNAAQRREFIESVVERVESGQGDPRATVSKGSWVDVRSFVDWWHGEKGCVWG